MSIPNEAQNPNEKTDYLGINEDGELIVKDTQLAEALQELSPEELDEIAGGRSHSVAGASGDINCTNIVC